MSNSQGMEHTFTLVRAESTPTQRANVVAQDTVCAANRNRDNYRDEGNSVIVWPPVLRTTDSRGTDEHLRHCYHLLHFFFFAPG